MSFEENIFINCPFDDDYFSLLRPLLFTVIYLGYNPKIATERSDSGEVRLNKICGLIDESKYSIHDLSRLKSDEADEFARLNMPFELGIDIGARKFGGNNHDSKKSLVLEKERYRYQAAISDIAGSDIKSHNDEPIKLIRAVRSWLIDNTDLRRPDSPTIIWYSFNDFMSDFYDKRQAEGFTDKDLEMMSEPEFIDYIEEWCGSN